MNHVSNNVIMQLMNALLLSLYIVNILSLRYQGKYTWTIFIQINYTDDTV